LLKSYIPLFLMYKINGKIESGEKKALMYIGAFSAAVDQKLIKDRPPQSFKAAVKKFITEKDVKVNRNGIVQRADGRWYDGREALKEIQGLPEPGMTNLIKWKATLENKYPGTIEFIDKNEESVTCASLALKVARKFLLAEKKNLPAISDTSKKIEILSLKAPTGKRNVSVEGGSWKLKDFLAVKKHIWEIKSGQHVWTVSYDLDASHGIRVHWEAEEKKSGTKWYKDTQGWWMPYEGHGKTRKEMKPLWGSIENIEKNEKELDKYLLENLESVIIVDEKDDNYLFYKFLDTKAVTKLSFEVAVAVDGKIVKDNKNYYKVRDLLRASIGLKDNPNIEIKYETKSPLLPGKKPEIEKK